MNEIISDNGLVVIYKLPQEFRPLKEFKKQITLCQYDNSTYQFITYCQLQIYIDGNVVIENSGNLRGGNTWYWINETFI